MLHKLPDQPTHKKKAEKSWRSLFQWLQNSPNTSTSHTGYPCSENQCSMNPSHAVTIHPTRPASLTYFSGLDEIEYVVSDPGENESTVTNTNTSHDLANIFPPGYYAAMQQAAKFGFLYSFVSATPVELFSQYLKTHHFTAQQIYCANQALRAIATLSLSAYMGILDNKSLCITLGMPLATFGLKYAGTTETISQLFPMVVLISAELLSNASNISKSLTTIIVSGSTGLLGNNAAKLSCHLLQHGFFAFKNHIDKFIYQTPTPQHPVTLSP